MKSVWLSLALLAAFAPLARAAPSDMNTATCQDWLDAGEDDQDAMVAWLRGYLSGRASSAMFDIARLRADAAILKTYCQNHATVGLVSAAGQWR